MRNLLFIIESIPDKEFLEKYGINFFKKKGVKVEFLYVASISRKNYYKKINIKKQTNYNDAFNKTLTIKYLNQIVSEETLVICTYTQNKNTIFIFDHLKKLKAKTAYISRENTPKGKTSFLTIFKILILDPFTFFKLLIKKIKYIDNKNLNYDYIFSAGEVSEKNYKKNPKSKIYRTHHPDYDLFKNAKKFKKYKSYGLFLSPATVNPDTIDKHPGEQKNNILNFNNKIYFKNLVKFLISLQKKTKTKIIVAQHPKDKYNLEKIIGFRCYKGKSVELVKSAKFIFSFDSSSFQFGVMSQKPIFFLTSKNLPTLVHNSILDRCKFFKKEPVYLEKKVNYNEINNNFFVDKKLYNKYFREYISNTKKKFLKYNSYEIIYKYLKNL